MKNKKNNPASDRSTPAGQRREPQGEQGSQQQQGESKEQRDQKSAQDKEQRKQQGQPKGDQRNQSAPDPTNQTTYEEDQSLGNQSLEDTSDDSLRAGGTEQNQGSLQQTKRKERDRGPADPHATSDEEENEDNLEDLSLKEHEKKNITGNKE